MIQIALIIIFLLPYFLWNLEYIIYKTIVKNYLKELYTYITTDENLVYTKYELSNRSIIYLDDSPDTIRSTTTKFLNNNPLFLDKIFDYHTYINITNNKLDISFYIIRSSLLFRIYKTLFCNLNNKIILEKECFHIKKPFTLILKDYYNLYNILKNLPNKQIEIVTL